MLKLLITLCLIITYTAPFGQVQHAINFGITKSYKDENFDIAGVSEHAILKNGFQVGTTVNVQISQLFHVGASLQFTQKGFHTIDRNQPPGTYYWNRKQSSNYIEIPINGIIKFNPDKALQFSIGTGPVVSYGISGKMDATLEFTNFNGQFYSIKTENYQIFSERGAKRMDIGWGLSLGLQYQKASLGLDYNYGLTSTITGGGWHYLKNRCFSLKVGYLLKK